MDTHHLLLIVDLEIEQHFSKMNTQSVLGLGESSKSQASPSTTTPSIISPAPQHFIVRTGIAGKNWTNTIQDSIWGFPSNAQSITTLANAIESRNAIVWFLTPRGRNPTDGRIIALCKPKSLRKRRQEDPADDDLGWAATGSQTAKETIVHNFEWRMNLGHVIFLQRYDDLLTEKLCQMNDGKRFSQSSIHVVKREELEGHLNAISAELVGGFFAVH